MKLTCSQEALSRGLQVVGRGVSNAAASTLPVLSNILLATDDGRLRLSSTDLKIGITLWIPAMIFQDGAITLPARLLTEFVNSLPNEQVDLSVSSGQVANVRCARFSANIRGIDADEFPLIPTISDAPSATIAAETLRGMINQVVFAASTDTTRGPLQGVYTTFSGATLTMTASDGYRLSVRNAQLSTPCEADFSVLIPARTVAELGRVLPDDASEVAITVTPNRSQILFHLENLDFLATLLNDQFVNYKQFIPKEYKTRVVAHAADLQKAVKIASYFARDGSSLLKLAIEAPDDGGGTVTVSAATQDLGDNASVVDGVVEGAGLQVGFNSKYLSEALGAMNANQVALELLGPTHAGVLRPVDGADFLHIIMPVTVPR
ncbi:MAG TPA: DNA polymerase III subunit beta [Chloroflexota bacterium]|nr:DNA polymerase III subunit beta [Chloroflexota bacterium]